MIAIDGGEIKTLCGDEAEILADACIVVEIATRILTKIHGEDITADIVSKMLGISIAEGIKPNRVIDKEILKKWN